MSNETICLSAGATPEAVENPTRLTDLIMEALAALEKTQARPKTKAKAKTSRKAAPKTRRKSK